MTASQIFTELSRWVADTLVQLGQSNHETEWVPLSGDAGFRCYWRVTRAGGQAMLAVYSPPDTEANASFIALADALRGHVSTPAIYAADSQRGFMLIEDFGDQLLWRSLREQPDNADCLYGEALMDLLALQQERPYQLALPSYGPQLLLAEMGLFRQWFVGELLGLDADSVWAELTPVWHELVASALAQPQVLVHRDFHSRNLIERPGQPLGVIDFQDAVWGPITYDLVSLLKDCYLQWPADKVRQWALCYSQLATDAGLMPEVDGSTFMRWFDLMGLQRHIKVLGIFARLALRDDKPRYLADLPLVLHYVLDCAGRYPSTQPLATLIEERLMPTISQQSWYHPVAELGVTEAE